MGELGMGKGKSLEQPMKQMERSCRAHLTERESPPHEGPPMKVGAPHLKEVRYSEARSRAVPLLRELLNSDKPQFPHLYYAVWWLRATYG